ncbi:uncharacterized protein LOC136082291 [Hydra vulgaris]|uniref:Uncharacterized protein LOC136082291 n=1 Tax=Hydra vulgaris TaxID=6087 RepID=A0ABM4C6B3_HYDVU
MASLTQIIFLSVLFHSSLVFSQDTLQTLFQCDFENGACGLSTSTSWVLNHYGTPVSNTGPSQSFNGNWYIYYEKLYNGNPTLTYTQTTPTPSNHVMLSFYLHAYGANINQFSISFNDANGFLIDDSYTIYGQLQNSSFDPFVPIVITKNLSRAFHTLEFTVVSTGDLSAVAIDDIVLSAVVLANSSWTTWTSYSACSVSCGPGTFSRSRICYSPANNYQTQGCIGNNTDVQTCNLTICPKSCYVNTSITCSNDIQSVDPADIAQAIQDIARTIQDINNRIAWWEVIVRNNYLIYCNSYDNNNYLAKVNGDISFVTTSLNNVFLYINLASYVLACSNNSAIQQSLLNFCETAVDQYAFINASLLQLQRYNELINSTILSCDGAVYQWTSWEDWYPCTASCNGGYTLKIRSCNLASNTNQTLICNGVCRGCEGSYYEYRACNTQRCTNVLCDVLKNVDCSTVSKSDLDPSKLLNVSSVNNVISEISVWPFLITDKLFESCNLDTLVDQLTKLNKQMAMAYSARNNTLAHLENIRDLIVCTANSFVQKSLYDMCLDAAQHDTVLNAIVNQLNLYVQQYQTAIDACKSCGFACSIIDSFIQVFFKSGM